MSQDKELQDAYEDVRLAELGKCGAEEYAAQAARFLDEARAKLELMVKGLPNREPIK